MNITVQFSKAFVHFCSSEKEYDFTRKKGKAVLSGRKN